MFKKIIISSFLVFLFSGLAIAETVATNSTETIKQNIASFIAKHNIPAAAVQIYQNGKPQTIYLGDAKPATQFDASALTEIMTGLLLAQQVDAAKVQLTTPLEQFFPSILSSRAAPGAGSSDLSKITLRSLATNTSGLPSNATMNGHQSNVVDDTWQPSTIGMTLLTKALETVAHKNIAELYQRQIFAALGMRSAKATSTELKISAPDMQKFLAAAIGLPGTPESVLYPMRLTQTAFIELNDHMIGLGWQIKGQEEEKKPEGTPVEEVAPVSDNVIKNVPDRPVFKPDRQYDKAGLSAYIAVLPNKKSGIAILLSAQVNEQDLAQLGQQILTGLSS